MTSPDRDLAEGFTVSKKPTGFFKSFFNRIEYGDHMYLSPPDQFSVPVDIEAVLSMPDRLKESQDGGRPTMPSSGSDFAPFVEQPINLDNVVRRMRDYVLIAAPDAKHAFSAVVKGENGGFVPVRYDAVKAFSACTPQDTIIWRGKYGDIILIPDAQKTLGEKVKGVAKVLLGLAPEAGAVFKDETLRKQTKETLFALKP